MASQSLYRKWRSQTFNDLVGQEEIIRTLKNELSSGKLAHAYLFTGPRGTGKTSTARLLAKTINCPNAKDGEPCNVCEQCREITAGSSFNVLEIDAASNRGIDSIRELREKVMVPPTNGRYKVYILDEAHMLTTEAFNALLKTLEEPPPHAIFVMATTDVHKMLPTVLSRCQRFDFRRITSRQIVEHLHFVAAQEHVELEKGSAELLARAAAGGMRDALSLLDQAIAYSGNTISLAQVQVMLGVADPRAMQNYISAIAALDTPRGLHLINELAEAGADLRQVNIQLAEYWRAMMLAKAGARIVDILDNTEDELREIVQMSKHFSLEEITECARIFAQNDLMQKSQATPQLGLELALLACINLHRQGQDGQAATMPATSTPAPVVPSTPAPSVPTRPNPSVQAERSQHTSAQPSPQPHFSPPSDSLLPPPAEMKQAFPEVQPLEERKTPATPAPQPVHVELHAVIPIPQSAPAISASADPAEADGQHTEAALPDWDDLSFNDDEEELDDSRSETIEPVDSVDLVEPAEPATTLSSVTVSAHVETSSTPLTVDVHIETEPAVPILTADDVREKWEYILRRVKTKKDGPLIQALLRSYTVAGVEYDNNALPITYIRATAPFHYDALRRKDTYLETIRWAVKVELGVESRIHLLSPNAEPPRSLLEQPTKPPVPTPAANNATTDEQPSPSPQSLAPLAHPLTPTPPAQPAHSPEQSQPSQTAKKPAPPSLARNSQVRENTNEMPMHHSPPAHTGTRQQTLEQHAKEHPVVQEVIRMFKAEPRDVRPK